MLRFSMSQIAIRQNSIRHNKSFQRTANAADPLAATDRANSFVGFLD